MKMNENPTQSTKTSCWQWVLAHFTFKGCASSLLLSSLSESQSNQTAMSSSAQITNSSSTQDASLSAAPVMLISADLLIASISPLSSLQVTSTPSSNLDLLHDVLKWLSDDDWATLQDYMFHNVSDINLLLEQVSTVMKEKQWCCNEKR